MADQPLPSNEKAEVYEAAKAAIGPRLSRRSFDYAWFAWKAETPSEWPRSGRRRGSPRRR